MSTAPPVPNAEPWVCCGCGAKAIGDLKPCACPTAIGYKLSDPNKTTIFAVAVCEPVHPRVSIGKLLDAYPNAGAISVPTRELRDLLRSESVHDQYDELLFAVARKCDGESRHDTALRYIRERENSAIHECEDSPTSASADRLRS